MFLKLQDHFPLRVSDWFAAGILTSWGMMVLGASPNAWHFPIYAYLAEMAPKHTWGAVGIALGVARLGALFINGSMRRTPHARAIGAFFSMFIWLQLTLAMVTSPSDLIAVICYPWLFLMDFYNVVRAAQDAKFSDMKAKALRGAPTHARSP